ncbi:MAG: acyl carrier protein [Acidobacteriota bacterium]|nr:acyl carrier protein [Acidobacteriota bacterium]
MSEPFDLKGLIAIVADQLVIDPADITAESHLADDLGIQSIDLIKIVMAIEEKYDMEFEDIDQEQLKTVGDAFRLLSEQFTQA